MENEFLTEQEAGDIVAGYMAKEKDPVTTQDIINTGTIPVFNGFVVKHGKVSDCLYGGRGTFVIPAAKEGFYRSQLAGLNADFSFFNDEADKDKPKFRIDFENPPLTTHKDLKPIFMVRTGRISTHDIERGSIPFKDQILALNHDFMRRLVIPWFGSSQFYLGLDANSVVIAAEKLSGLDYENVFRAYMAKSSTTTSLYHAYVVEGRREFAGYDLPGNLYPNGPIPMVMDTPSTKDDMHDITVAPELLYQLGICSQGEYEMLRNNSFCAFGAVSAFLLTRGIILADTKTEHGYDHTGRQVAMDELYTMDSSRFWLLDDYRKQQTLYLAGDDDGLATYLKETQPGIQEKDFVLNSRVIMVPRSFSKEFARGFSVKDQQYTSEQRAAIAVRYILGIQHLLHSRFEPDMRPWHDRVIADLGIAVKRLFG